jgi:hypothetical protein
MCASVPTPAAVPDTLIAQPWNLIELRRIVGPLAVERRLATRSSYRAANLATEG